jgi:hypothetical protein
MFSPRVLLVRKRVSKHLKPEQAAQLPFGRAFPTHTADEADNGLLVHLESSNQT